MSVLGGGGSWSARREPPAIRTLLTTFSLMDDHIGENLNELQYPQGHRGQIEFAKWLILDLNQDISRGC